jgi:heme-degrading monooxygenase HmoA
VFLGGWEQTRDFLRTQPGYLGAQLHRSLSPSEDFRFVNIAFYESPQTYQAAIQQPGFREVAAAIPHRPHPWLYEVVHRHSAQR